MNSEILNKISEYGVIPVIAIKSVDSALRLADALIEGGLPVLEITFRTDAAAETISLLKEKRPELILGAGTVLTTENLQKAKNCGATFAVAPGLNPAVVSKAKELDIAFAPGISNPTDIEQALSLGVKVMKFFPAEACGGTKMLNAISAPYKHTNVRFIPTGGINASNLQSYLEMPIVLACGGTWIAKKDDIAQSKWNEITERCKKVAEVVSNIEK